MTKLFATTLRRIASLKLDAKQMAEVLAIVADVQAENDRMEAVAEVRRAKDRARKSKKNSNGIPAEAQEIVVAKTADAKSRGFHVIDGGAEFQQKEIPPTPPKEKQLPLQEYFHGSGFEEVQGSSEPRARAKKSACRLPDDWAPTIEGWAFARKLLTEQRVQFEFEQFRDYWFARAGPHAVKRDWDAAWRTWCRKASNENHGGNGHAEHRRNGTSSHNGGGHSARAFEFARRAAGTAGRDG